MDRVSVFYLQTVPPDSLEATAWRRQPGGELVITNIGPPLELGGIIPDTTLSGLLSVTLGNSQGGEGALSTVFFVPSPEPAPFSLYLVVFSILAFVAIRRRAANAKQSLQR
jgi:hypothetical protein